MGLELELDISELAVLPPLRTESSAEAARPDDDADGCVTPTSAASLLGPAAECPPAPRKPRPARRKHRRRPPPAPQGFYAVPHDLAAVFVLRASAPPCKKIRVHVVG